MPRFARISIVPSFVMAAICLSPTSGCRVPDRTHQVEHHGPMRQVLREGRTEPRVHLADLDDRGFTVAVGALAGLEGEVTVLDGEVWVARVEDGQLLVEGPEPRNDDAATLLSMARVAGWTRTPLTDAAGRPVSGPGLTGRTLEAAIAAGAVRHGIDAAEPFAFVIEGTMLELDLHVINGACPRAGRPSPETTPWRWSTDEPVEAIIVGVHAEGREGEMTHHGSSIHVHAMLDVGGRLITGHVDQLRVGPSHLRLPHSDQN